MLVIPDDYDVTASVALRGKCCNSISELRGRMSGCFQGLVEDAALENETGRVIRPTFLDDLPI